jgi:glycine/D-amino acid oxidase-like deaminating enzyme
LPDDVVGGIHSLSDGYIAGQMFVDALVEAITRMGGQIVTDGVEALEIESGRCTGVQTATGRLTADVVAVTCGSWSAKLFEDFGLPLNLFHIRLQGAETAPIEQRFAVNLYGPSFFHEYEFIREVPGYDDDLVLHPLMRIMGDVGMLECLVQRADGRLLMGCPIEFVEDISSPPLPSVAGLAQVFGILGDHIPATQHTPVEQTWAGIASQTADGLPIMDRVDGVEGLFVGAGHAYGATVGSGSGKILSDLILGRGSEIDTSPFRYDREAVQKRATKVLMYG